MSDDDWDDDAIPAEFTGQRLIEVNVDDDRDHGNAIPNEFTGQQLPSDNAPRPPKPYSSFGRCQFRDLQRSRFSEDSRGRGQQRPSAELVFQIGKNIHTINTSVPPPNIAKLQKPQMISPGGSIINGCQVLNILAISRVKNEKFTI